MFQNVRALKEVVEIIQDIRAKDFGELKVDVIELLGYLNLDTEAQNLGSLFNHLADHEYRLAFADLLIQINAWHAENKLVTGRSRKSLKAELAVAEADPKLWFSVNRQAYLDGASRPLLQLIRKRHPELDEEIFNSLCSGTLVQDTLSGKLDKEKVIAFIDKILPILAVICGIVPYLIPVYITLKIVSLIYHHNHPQMIGLTLEDFV